MAKTRPTTIANKSTISNKAEPVASAKGVQPVTNIPLDKIDELLSGNTTSGATGSYSGSHSSSPSEELLDRATGTRSQGGSLQERAGMSSHAGEPTLGITSTDAATISAFPLRVIEIPLQAFNSNGDGTIRHEPTQRLIEQLLVDYQLFSIVPSYNRGNLILLFKIRQ